MGLGVGAVSFCLTRVHGGESSDICGKGLQSCSVNGVVGVSIKGRPGQVMPGMLAPDSEPHPFN